LSFGLAGCEVPRTERKVWLILQDVSDAAGWRAAAFGPLERVYEIASGINSLSSALCRGSLDLQLLHFTGDKSEPGEDTSRPIRATPIGGMYRQGRFARNGEKTLFTVF
jgi:hypothetical protein